MITSKLSEREEAGVVGEGERALPRAAETAKKAAAAQKEEEEEGKAAAEGEAAATAERAVAGGKAHVEVGGKEEEHMLHKARLLQEEKKSKEFAEKEACPCTLQPLHSRAEELHNKFAKQVLNI